VSDGEGQDLGPLPAGRHGYSREQVAHNQRERLIAALAQVVNERGYNEITIADVTAAAQVSRRTFYEHFDSKEACFLGAFDVVVEHLHRLVEEACRPIPDWTDQVVAGVGTVLDFFVAEPELARLCMVDSLTAGPVAAERYRDAITGFTPLLHPGRARRDSSLALPNSTEDTVVGSLASVMTRAIVSGEGAELKRLMPDFVAFVLMPYIGPKEAHRIADEASAA